MGCSITIIRSDYTTLTTMRLLKNQENENKPVVFRHNYLNMSLLPNGVLLCITSKLTPTDLCRLSYVCKSFHILFSSNISWHIHCTPFAKVKYRKLERSFKRKYYTHTKGKLLSILKVGQSIETQGTEIDLHSGDTFQFTLECTNVSSTPFTLVKLIRPYRRNTSRPSLDYAWEIHSKVIKKKTRHVVNKNSYTLSTLKNGGDNILVDNDFQTVPTGKTVSGSDLFFSPGGVLKIKVSFLLDWMLDSDGKNSIKNYFNVYSNVLLQVWLTYRCRTEDATLLTGEFHSTPVYVTLSKPVYL